MDNGLTRVVSRVTNIHSRMWVNAEDCELVCSYTHRPSHLPTHVLISSVFSVQPMKAWGNRGSAPLILSLGIR
jgi:hypothetical protein